MNLIFLPDREKAIDHQGGVCNPLKSRLFRQVKHDTGIACGIKTEPKQVECENEEAAQRSVKEIVSCYPTVYLELLT